MAEITEQDILNKISELEEEIFIVSKKYNYYKDHNYLANNYYNKYKKYVDSIITSNYSHPAIYNLHAFIYHCGIGVEKDFKKALEYFIKSADLNYAKAYCNISDYYFYGIVVQKDIDISLKWCKKAIKQNISEGYYIMGFYYYSGFGVSQDINKAIKYLMKAVKRNYNEATLLLGIIYKKFIKDYNKSLYWLHLAVQHNIKLVYNTLGGMYYDGIGVERNINKAIEYYQKGADLEHHECKINLILCYYNNEHYVKKCIELAQEFLKDKIDSTGLVLLILGTYYFNGIGVEIDYDIAHDMLFRIANTDTTEINKNIKEEAIDMLVEIYRNGLGRLQDETMAKFWEDKLREEEEKEEDKVA